MLTFRSLIKGLLVSCLSVVRNNLLDLILQIYFRFPLISLRRIGVILGGAAAKVRERKGGVLHRPRHAHHHGGWRQRGGQRGTRGLLLTCSQGNPYKRLS